MAVGYDQQGLAQRAAQIGYQGDMRFFPQYLEQNPDVARQYFAQQDADINQQDNIPQFQTGGVVAPAVVPGSATNIVGVDGQPLVYPPGYEDPYQQQSPFLSQPDPPADVIASGNWKEWVTENWVPNPDYTPGAQPAVGVTPPTPPTPPSIGEITGRRVLTPQLPYGTQFQAAVTPFEQAQNIAATTGQVGADLTIAEAAQVPISQTEIPTTAPQAVQVAAEAATPAVQQAAIQAAQIGAPTQTIEAAQQAQTQIANLQAAQQEQAIQVQAPADRALQAAEQISGPAQQAVQAAAFVEPVLVAAQANPSLAATVQGQLDILSQQFAEGNVPFWAAGAIRTATQQLEARGLGASSMTGQAIVQAALEASFPIAQADARTVAAFEAQNLTNRQQTAMLTGQYRAQFLNQEFDQAFQTRVRNAATISDIANRNFTADQQIALENARFAQTVDLTNLGNEQALVMANAGALANLDISNLNNRQQAEVQNAQNFLQLDVGNLNNSQQAAVLNSQQQTQSILTDAAAENAARQFNAASQQQTDQFFANLISSIAQNNTAQSNAMNQFNAGEVNALQRFNSEISNQRDQFNARNQLAIEQSNAVWRREIATTDTASLNFQNQFNAQNLLGLSNESYDNLW